MINSISNNTMKQYDSSIKRWWCFCILNKINPYEASVPFILQFLNECFQNGASYGTLNTTRSALSLLMGPRIGSDDRLKRFMKGVFRSKPPLPKYNVTWDPAVVLEYLAGLYPNDDLSLEMLTKKLATLLALTSGHRVQTLSMIKVHRIRFENDGVLIHIPDIIKTSRIRSSQQHFT